MDINQPQNQIHANEQKIKKETPNIVHAKYDTFTVCVIYTVWDKCEQFFVWGKNNTMHYNM